MKVVCKTEHCLDALLEEKGKLEDLKKDRFEPLFFTGVARGMAKKATRWGETGFVDRPNRYRFAGRFLAFRGKTRLAWFERVVALRL